MNHLKLFPVEEPSKGSKFIAIFNDGSGASLFVRLDEGEYVDSNGDYYPSGDCFDNYLHWIPLPDDYVLWYEERGEV